jgi:hypothetical protein
LAKAKPGDYRRSENWRREKLEWVRDRGGRPSCSLLSVMVDAVALVRSKASVKSFRGSHLRLIGGDNPRRHNHQLFPSMRILLMAEKKLTDLFYDTLYFAAGLLAAGQAVEHYEISRYGTLKTWATRLGLKDAVTLLDQNLQEEKKTDILLSKLAEASINAEAG